MRNGGALSETSLNPIRRAALEYGIPYTTTLSAAKATLAAIRALKEGKLEVKSLQEYHEMV